MNVGKIEGAQQKTLVAATFGVPIILPEENMRDIETMDASVRFTHIIYIQHIKELIQVFPPSNHQNSLNLTEIYNADQLFAKRKMSAQNS